jgi:nicotinate-nucleotide adenylyltransferase
LKLGVFGGTFDPIHTGHLVVAEEVRVRLALDEVLFVPAGHSPFKLDRAVTRAAHRMNMVALATEDNPHFRVSDMEVVRPGPSYSVDTLEELARAHGKDSGLFMMVGADALREFDRWHQPQRLLDVATLVCLARPEAPQLDPESLESVRRGATERVAVIEGPLIGVSSTNIRQRVSQGLSIKYLVSEPVEAYIYEHGLYKDSGGQGQFAWGVPT